MKKIGLYYNFDTVKTKRVANKIKEAFENSGEYEIVAVDVDEKLTEEQFMEYDYMLLGAATWMDGELPYYWDEFVPAMEDLDMNGKHIAIFGLGDQKNGTENFQDAIGLLGYLLEDRGAKLYGFTNTEGYEFEESYGVRDDKFMGLSIDIENQAALTDERIEAWVKQLQEEGF
ncbi:flavodoxin I [Balneicella halophila]|uniref:Flavodoxin n=1 Tax=Balneicella halophila TaxID=1537566 RepID=A0A7L4UP11_BALHA|nr:flavodoxin [Balneicella halophila]PVX50848.1 flavodoxin I [Balneicella halophila]